jgi:predicted Zn-dependent peptidase
MPLRDAIAAHGGMLAVDVSVRAARFYVEAPPPQLPAVLGLLARALAHPAVSRELVASARTEVAGRAAEADRLPLDVGLSMVRESYYRGAAGQPSAGRTATIAQLGDADVMDFLATNYRRSGAALAAVGAVDDAGIAAAQALVAGLPDGGTPLPAIAAAQPLATPKRIVTHRDIGAPWLVLGFAAPPPGDRDYAAMLVVQALVAQTFDVAGPVTKSAYARGIGTVYAVDLRPAQFAVYVNGAQLDIATGLRDVDVVFKALAKNPIRGAVLAQAKTRANGSYAIASLSLADRAADLVQDAENAIDPATIDVGAAIAKVTASDVQHAAKTYLQRYTAAVVFPRESAAAPAPRS